MVQTSTGCVKILEATDTILPGEMNFMEVPPEPDGTNKIITIHAGETNPSGMLSKLDRTDGTYTAETNIIHTTKYNQEYEHFRCFKQVKYLL